jgi:ABC-type Fe3+/spermidine/putrescine transport system ATPase subunit
MECLGDTDVNIIYVTVDDVTDLAVVRRQVAVVVRAWAFFSKMKLTDFTESARLRAVQLVRAEFPDALDTVVLEGARLMLNEDMAHDYDVRKISPEALQRATKVI